MTRLTVDALPAQSTVVDIGCGTGNYLAGVLDQLPGVRGLELDTSQHAPCAQRPEPIREPLRRAGTSSAPSLSGQAVDVLLDVFASHNPSEFH